VLSCCCYLELDPMTLIYEADLKIIKMYLLTNKERSMSRLSILRALQTYTQTDTTECTTTEHSRVVTRWYLNGIGNGHEFNNAARP